MLDQEGLPHCPLHGAMMVEDADELDEPPNLLADSAADTALSG
ncbi:hypothetical protein [Paraburkholderia sp. BR14320]